MLALHVGEQQLVSSRSLVVHNQNGFEQRLLSRISACGGVVLALQPQSLPHLLVAGLAGREERLRRAVQVPSGTLVPQAGPGTKPAHASKASFCHSWRLAIS